MFRKIAFGVMAAVATACSLAGCAGKGEGDGCSGADDCSADLTCQPVPGRTGDYCCPTPADNSSKSTCHAADGDGG
jgi:hypothetical protein